MSLTQVFEGGFLRHCSATCIISYSITIPPPKEEKSWRCRCSSLSAGSAISCFVWWSFRTHKPRPRAAPACQGSASSCTAAQRLLGHKPQPRKQNLEIETGWTFGGLGLTEKISPSLLLYPFYYLTTLLPCRWSWVKRQNSCKKAQIWSTQHQSQILLESYMFPSILQAFSTHIAIYSQLCAVFSLTL